MVQNPVLITTYLSLGHKMSTCQAFFLAKFNTLNICTYPVSFRFATVYLVLYVDMHAYACIIILPGREGIKACDIRVRLGIRVVSDCWVRWTVSVPA